MTSVPWTINLINTVTMSSVGRNSWFLFYLGNPKLTDIGGSEFLSTRKEVNLLQILYQTILSCTYDIKCFEAIKTSLYYVITGDWSSRTTLPGETMFTPGLTPSGEKLTTGSWPCWVCWEGKPFGWITDVPGEISDIVTGWKLIRITTGDIVRFF